MNICNLSEYMSGRNCQKTNEKNTSHFSSIIFSKVLETLYVLYI